MRAAGPGLGGLGTANVPLLALVLGFRPRPRALAPGSSDPGAAPSLLSPVSLLVFRLRRLALGTRRAGDGSAPVGQDRQWLRPGSPLSWPQECHLSWGGGEGRNQTTLRGRPHSACPPRLRGRVGGPSAGTQLGCLHMRAMGAPPINEQGGADPVALMMHLEGSRKHWTPGSQTVLGPSPGSASDQSRDPG